MPKFLLILLLFSPFYCLSQNSISGKVLNLTDKNPIADVSVFLSNATVGCKTNSDGSFKLTNVKNGQYTLVVSIIGYETYSETVVMNNGDIALPNIELLSKTIQLNEVKIKPDVNWDRNYAWFKQQFLGSSDYARQCKILNPQMLDLNYDESTQTLTASSYDFLEIENDALGYKLKYLLTDFKWEIKNGYMYYVGTVLFQELDGKPSQHHRWEKNRVNTYTGSSMHFLRSILSEQLTEQGFGVHQLTRTPNIKRPADSVIKFNIAKYKKLSSKDSKWTDSMFYWVDIAQTPKINEKLMDQTLVVNEIVKLTNRKGIYALNCDHDCLYITYTKKQSHPANISITGNLIRDKATILSFNTPNAFFDSNGCFLDPRSLSISGAWGNKRMADLLPVDYETPQTQ